MRTELGEKLYAWRQEKGKTIPECERESGIPHSTWEKAEQKSASLKKETAEKLTAYTGEDFMRFAREGKPRSERYHTKGPDAPADAVPDSTGARVRRWRLEHGKTIRQCCDESGMKIVTWASIERGVSQPGIKSAQILTAYTGIDLTPEEMTVEERKKLMREVQDYRSTVGMSQRDFAAAAGIGRNLLSRVETGRGYLTVEQAARIRARVAEVKKLPPPIAPEGKYEIALIVMRKKKTLFRSDDYEAARKFYCHAREAGAMQRVFVNGQMLRIYQAEELFTGQKFVNSIKAQARRAQTW